MKPGALNVILAVAAGVTTAGFSALGLRAMQASPAVEVGPWAFALTSGYEREALASVRSGFTPANVQRSKEASRKSLSLSPLANIARLRGPYLDSLRQGYLDSQGLEALNTSYSLIAYDYESSDWRIGFALSNWNALPQDLQESVHKEALAFDQTARRARIRSAMRAVRDPVARQVVAGWRAEMARRQEQLLQCGTKDTHIDATPSAQGIQLECRLRSK